MDIEQMTIFRVLILILICQYGCTQDFSSKSISIKINEDSLYCIEPCNAITISFTLSNNSDNDILVYGLLKGGPIPSFNGLSDLCDIKRTGTGMQFALYHPDGTEELAEFEIRDRLGQNPITKKVLDSALRQMKIDFLKSAMVLKGNETRTFVKQVPLDNFTPQKGLYYLQLCYYCGQKTADILDLNEIRKSGAKLFQGCAISEKIPFRIN